MEITLKTTKHQHMVDITDQINDLVDVKDGICNVFVPHATAAIIINENDDPNVCADIFKALNNVIPEHNGYLHDRVDNNAGAHIKAAILGPGETIPIEDGKLKLGRWQAVMLVELDGPRQRTINVKIL